jgi:guanine deaminase
MPTIRCYGYRMDDSIFMKRAIVLSREAAQGGGGPFGALIVLDGKIVGEGTNKVVPSKDPTAHGEIVAIRAACITLRTHDLTGATIFTSCEPCPMCLGAIWWARIARIVYGNTRADAAAIGFDDDAIYEEISRPVKDRQIPLKRIFADEALAVFEKWVRNPERIMY